MARVEVRLPQHGMGMSEAEIVEWHHGVGDLVDEGEVLITADAAKSSIEINAPAAGRLVEVVVSVGDVPLVGDLLAVLDTDSGGR